MITLGIDMSSQAPNTAACKIEWFQDGTCKVHPAFLSCDDTCLDELIKEVNAVGIDAPFGWPEPFRKAVSDGISIPWMDCRDKVILRTTDWETIRILKHLPDLKNRPRPLSVSSDRIALPAMRTMALLQRQPVRVTDKAGDGKFYEVYPAATLAVWGVRLNGYKAGGKAKTEAALRRRREMVCQLRAWIPEIPEDYAQTDHGLDALVASLSARAAAFQWTFLPGKDAELAKTEGWIHIPDPAKCQNPASLLTPPPKA